MALADTVKGGLYMVYSVILFRQLSRHLFRHKDTIYSDINKKRTNLSIYPHLVDQTPKISNLLEDIKKVERFVQSVGHARYSDIKGSKKTGISSKKN